MTERMTIEEVRKAERGSKLESRLLADIHAAGLPEPVREYRFDATRRWRFDLAWPDRMLAVEVEGGVWTGGRHTRPTGFIADAAKYNAAAAQGWTVLRFTRTEIMGGTVTKKRQKGGVKYTVRERVPASAVGTVRRVLEAAEAAERSE